LRSALLIVLFVTLLPTKGLASELSLPDGDWRQIDVSGLTVITDIHPDKAIELGEKLNRFRDWLEIFAVVDAPYRRPEILYLFHDRDAIEPFLPLYQGKPAHIAGFTSPAFDRIFMALDVSSYPNPLTVIYHEYVHAFLFERAPQCPMWVQEGIAEFNSDFEIDGDYIEVGTRLPRLEWMFKKYGFLSTARFLSLDNSDPEYNEGTRQSSFYAQAWATIHYLLTAKDRRHRFKDYMQRLHHGQPEPLALYAAFGKHFPRPERDLKPYVLQHDFPHFRLERPAKTSADDAVVHDMRPVEMYVAFGDLLLRSHPADDPQAAEYFQAALDIDPDEPTALRGLATAQLRRENRAEAERVLARAAELPEIDPATSTLLGSLLLEDYQKATSGELVDEGAEIPDSLRRAREQFERALSVQESNPFAMDGLGATLFFLRDYSKAQEWLERAAEATPWRTEPQQTLVALHIHQGNLEQAREVYEAGLKPLTRPLERFQTQVALVEAEIRHARKLAADGDPTQAALILTEARRTAEGRDVVRVLDQALANIATSEAVQRYNEAVSKIRGQHYESAAKILRDLQSKDLEEPLGPAVDRLLESLKEAQHAS